MENSARHPKMIILDENPLICEALGGFLARLGFHTKLANSLEKAIFYLQQDSFDIVLSEISIAGGGSMKLLEERKRYPGTCFYLMSNNADAYRESAIALGARAVFLKGVDLSEIKSRLCGFIDGFHIARNQSPTGDRKSEPSDNV